MLLKSASFMAGARRGIGNGMMQAGKTLRKGTRPVAAAAETATAEPEAKKKFWTFGKKLMAVGIAAPAVAAGLGAHAAAKQTGTLDAYRQAMPPPGMGPGY